MPEQKPAEQTDLQWGDFTKIHDLGGRSVARLGFINLGVKEGKRTTATGTFVFSDQALEDFPEIGFWYADKETGEVAPTKIHVMLVSEDRREIFPYAYELAPGGYTRCRGDGQRALRSLCSECNRYACKHYEAERVDQEMKCPCDLLQKGTCKLTGRLTFMLHRVSKAGVWTIKTSSWNSIKDLLAGLDTIEADKKRLSFIPLELRLHWRPIKYEGGKRTKKPILAIGVDAQTTEHTEDTEIHGNGKPVPKKPPEPLPPVEVPPGASAKDGSSGKGSPPPSEKATESTESTEGSEGPDGELFPDEPFEDDPEPLDYPKDVTAWDATHGTITDQQIRAAKKLVEKAQLNIDEQRLMLEPFDRPGLSAFSAPQACDLIDWLNKVAKERQR